MRMLVEVCLYQKTDLGHAKVENGISEINDENFSIAKINMCQVRTLFCSFRRDCYYTHQLLNLRNYM